MKDPFEWYANSCKWIETTWRKKKKSVSMHWHTLELPFKRQIVTDSKLRIASHILVQESQQSFSYSFWVNRMTISNIVTETVEDPFLKTPLSEEDWKSISERFEEVWSFSHAVGAMDRKHIRIEYPKLKFVSATFLLVCFVG